MKNRFTIFFIALCLLSVSAFSQEIIEHRSLKNKSFIGGDITVNSSTQSILGDKSYTTFEVSVPTRGSYYLNLWVLGAKLADGNFVSYDMALNSNPIEARVQTTVAGWHRAEITTGTLDLEEGINEISFIASVPEIPHIEFIRLSTEKEKAFICSENYNQRLEKIKEESRQRMLAKQNSSDSLEDISVLNEPFVLSTRNYVNPEGNYQYLMEVPYHYTFNVSFALSAGQQYYVTSIGLNGHKTIIELFYMDDPTIAGWSAISNSASLASLNVTIPISGVYLIRVRSAIVGERGICNIIGNGQYYWEEREVSNTSYPCYVGTDQVYTTFTAYSSDIDGVMTVENGSTFPNKVLGYNRYYRTGSNYEWDPESGIKRKYNVPINWVTVYDFYTYQSKETCDVYIGCMNSNIMPYFPNLNENDAIQSAPATTRYNCISWSGGITNYWEWPLNPFSDYYVSGNDLASFDRFYAANRYTGCATFTRDGVTPSNKVINLYAIVSGSYREYTHAAVKKGADNHPHGYSWESKPGSLMRTFHPEEALNGNSAYGSPVEYYRVVREATSASLLEAMADGLAVIEKVSFTSLEKEIIEVQKKSLTSLNINEFESKYEAWKSTWFESPFSDPRKYTLHESYDELLTLCKSNPEFNFLVFEKLEEGEVFLLPLIYDLTLVDNEENEKILEEVKNENNEAKTLSTSSILRSPHSNAMKYVKKLLANEKRSMFSQKVGNTTGWEGITYSNTEEFSLNVEGNNISVNFSLKNTSNVTIDIYDLNGRLLAAIGKNLRLSKGVYQYDYNKLSSGIYLVRFVVDGNINVKKISF